MSQIVKIEADINLDAIKETIDAALDLNDNEAIFNSLAEFGKVRNRLKEIDDQMKSIEKEVKGAVKNKADALYGPRWEAIKGSNYKITQSPTGSIFSISGGVEPDKEFLTIKKSLDTDKVTDYIKENGSLPKGVEYNPDRGYSIRLTVNEDG